jgi:hypothetical protein
MQLRAHRLRIVAAAAALAILTSALYLNAEPEYLSESGLSPQSHRNVAFAARGGSLGQALASYPGVWPPLYPVLLRGAYGLGVAPDRVNLILFWLTLLWLHRLTRHSGRSGPALLLLVALSGHQYANLCQITAEPLSVWLALVGYERVLCHGRRPTTRGAAGVGAAGAAICLTRYMGAVWWAPVAALAVAAAPLAPARRLPHALVTILLALLPLSGWIAYQHSKTGFLTGMDRFEDRVFPGRLAQGRDLGRLDVNAALAAKTLALDFASPTRSAFHYDVQGPWNSRLEQSLAALLAGFLGYWGWLAWRWRRALARPRELLASPGALAAILFGAYLVETVVLFSVTNNDPIYTRFLYPSYAFLLLAAWATYAKLVEEGAPGWMRAPFQAAFALSVLVQGTKSLAPLFAG